MKNLAFLMKKMSVFRERNRCERKNVLSFTPQHHQVVINMIFFKGHGGITEFGYRSQNLF